MTIIEALQTEGIRLSNGERWLVGDESGGWIVLERHRGAGVVLIKTESEEEAVGVLMEGECYRNI